MDFDIDVAVQELIASAKESQKLELAKSAGYAESGPTYDPSGNYLCGTCSFRLLPDRCATVKGKISMKTGGCIIYHHGASAYTETLPHQFPQDQVIYTERPNVKGFGCKRCEYGKDEGIKKPHCIQWDLYVDPNACCFANEGKDDVVAPDLKSAGVQSPTKHVHQHYEWKIGENDKLSPVRAYGTSEGATKGWDTRGRGRKAEDKSVLIKNPKWDQFKDGQPIKVVGYHATDDQPQFGKRGIFFSPEPSPDYGGKLYRTELDLKNPITVNGDQMDAAKKLFSPEDYKTAEKMFEDQSMGTIEPQDYYTYVDRKVAETAKAKGYDSVIYNSLDMGSLSRMEFQVFDKSVLDRMEHVGGWDDYVKKYPDEMTNAEHLHEELNQKIKKAQMKAYGTSEGATKGWDTRGRGRKEEEKEPLWQYPVHRGTTTQRLDEILREGLVPAKHPMELDMPTGSHMTSQKGNVYVTYHEDTAKKYAQFKQRYAEAKPGDIVQMSAFVARKPEDAPEPVSGTKPLVITMRVPTSLMKEMKDDPDSPDYADAYMFKGTIPTKYIDKMQVLEGGKWKEFDWKHRVSAEEEGDTVPIHFVLGDISELGDDDVDAYGTSEGAEKGWDSRGRGQKDYRTETGVHVGIFDRPEEAGPGSVPVTNYFKEDAPDAETRLKIADAFEKAVKESDQDFPIDKLVPLQKTVTEDRLERAASNPSPKPLSIFHYKDKYYLIDGHHRVAGYAKKGLKTVGSVVFHMPQTVAAEAFIWDQLYAEAYEKMQEIRAAASEELHGASMFRGIPIIGFSAPQEEIVRATASRVPPELMFNVERIVSAPELGAKHGRYEPETKTVYINPHEFALRQRFGEGPGWIHHMELTMVHEFMHSIYAFLPEKVKDQWRDLSGWMIGTKDGQAPAYVEKRPGWEIGKTSKWTHRKGVKFPRHYSERNDDEDFADCATYALLGKGHMVDMRKKLFIEKLFHTMVQNYPKFSVQSPSRAYGERELAYRNVQAAAGWHGVDLDGTLAEWHGFKGDTHIGRPIPKMLARVKKWLDKGEKVKIITARVSKGESEKVKTAIQDWTQKYLGQRLEVTNEKDFLMIDLWDDRARRVQENTGKVIR